MAIGNELPESLRGAPSAAALRSLDEFTLGSESDALVSALESLYKAIPGRSQCRWVLRQLRDKPAAPANGAHYPENSFGAGLAQVARLIKGKVGLSVATIDLGGWDSHFT